MKKQLCLLIVFLLLFTSFHVAAADAGTICILPEDFKESLGTFTVITDPSGSGNAFRNVALRGVTNEQTDNTIPAQVNVSIKEQGDYSVWVHTRDYDTNPGRRFFKMAIDKKTLTENTQLGAHKQNGWKWEKAGTLSLEAGVHTVKVYDASAFYARLDMIILTKDTQLQLPETSAQMQEMMDTNRMQPTGVLPEVPLIYNPNQVFRDSFFYTAFGADTFNETGTWQLVRNQWSYNGETPSKDMCFVGRSDSNPQNAQNAKITFAVPKDGIYYVWIRSRDFAEDQGRRLFEVSVDGVNLEGVYGDHGVDGWAWERKQTQKLTKGYHTLELKDSYSYYARCDYFLITDDVEFVPLNTKTALYKLLGEAEFSPENVVPDLPCPVAYEPIAGNTEVYPQRPSTEYAVLFNQKYIGCACQMRGKEGLVSAESVLTALGYTLVHKTETEMEFVRGDETLKFIVGDCFAYRGKQKIEMRLAAELIQNEIFIPASFLNKIDNVKAQVNGKDIEIVHRIWK